MQMATHAVGADHHQRLDGIAGGLLHVGGGQLDALLLRLGLHLVADSLLHLAQFCVEGGDQFAIGVHGQCGFFHEAPRAFCTT